MSEMFVEVILDERLAKPLDYAVPKELAGQVAIGMRVEVFLKTALQRGTIAKIKQETQWVGVKPIVRLLSERGELSESLWKLAEWMAKYYCAPLQRVLRCFIPPNVRQDVQEKTQIWLTLAKSHDESIEAIGKLRGRSPKQAAVLEALLTTPKGAFLSDFASSRSAVNSLIEKKLLSSRRVAAGGDLLLEEEFFQTAPKSLNREQGECLEAIRRSLEKQTFAAHLIYGVTGSGKTEVYLQAIGAALEQNRSAILLVPEISLT